MANITRIKAGDSKKPKSSDRSKGKSKKDQPKAKSAAQQPQAAAKTPKPAHTKPAKTAKKPLPKALRVITWPFRMLAKPFIALGRYIHDSWLEIRQVRWPSRGATWKLVLAVLVYAAVFMAFIALLDALFTFIFNNLLG